jgi:hypothetical protein
VTPAKGVAFEQMTEAPESGYRSQNAVLKPGLALYFRDESYGPKRIGSYGKLFVESISDAPPDGVPLVEPLR